jgi:hypothetical protein
MLLAVRRLPESAPQLNRHLAASARPRHWTFGGRQPARPASSPAPFRYDSLVRGGALLYKPHRRMRSSGRARRPVFVQSFPAAKATRQAYPPLGPDAGAWLGMCVPATGAPLPQRFAKYSANCVDRKLTATKRKSATTLTIGLTVRDNLAVGRRDVDRDHRSSRPHSLDRRLARSVSRRSSSRSIRRRPSSFSSSVR